LESSLDMENFAGHDFCVGRSTALIRFVSHVWK
jgi:hypothetical protein